MYWDKEYDEESTASEDMFDVYERLGLEDDEPVSALNRAGMDDLTPVDTMMNANGDYIYVTVP